MINNTEKAESLYSEVYFNSTDEEYFEKRINANIIKDKNDQKIKQIIIMVKKAFDKGTLLF